MEIKSKKEFETVDEYIASFPENIQKGLNKIRQTVRKAAPEAEECISYQMPAMKYHGILLYYAAFTKHYGFFAMPGAIMEFKDKLTPYELSKGTIRIPYNKPIPIKLITEIVKFRVKENLAKQALKDAAKRSKTQR